MTHPLSGGSGTVVRKLQRAEYKECDPAAAAGWLLAVPGAGGGGRSVLLDCRRKVRHANILRGIVSLWTMDHIPDHV